MQKDKHGHQTFLNFVFSLERFVEQEAFISLTNFSIKVWEEKKEVSFTFSSVQLTNCYCCPDSCPKPEPGVKWASELALVPVDELSPVVGNAVKGQNPRMLVQIDSKPAGFG